MRHQVFGKKLNRDIKERKALFRSLVKAMIIHGRIKTTYAKAKAVGSLLEKLVTKAKEGSRVSKNQISSFLNQREPIKKLINDVAPRFSDKVGGYIRMIRLGRRRGDNAKEVLLEWSVSPQKTEVAKAKPAKPVSAKAIPVKKEKKEVSAKGRSGSA